jgi:hypothetical protein
MDEQFFEPYKPSERSPDRHFTTPNYLSPTAFRVLIPRTPKITHFIQSVNIPSVVLSSMDIPSYKGFPKQEVPSNLDISDQIIVNFNIDEDMENWQSIYDWMTAIVPSNENNSSVNSKEDLYSEIVVLIYNSAKKLKKKFTFHKCYPVNLSSFEFNSSSTEIDPILISVNFEYSHFTIENV